VRKWVSTLVPCGFGSSCTQFGRSIPQWPPDPPNMKILVAIASYGTRNDRYLAEVIRRYRAMPYTIDLVVLSNIPKEVGPGVKVQVGLPAKDPWSLPFGHKKLFADNLDNYDLFIYSEDDTPLSERNIEAFLRVSEILPENEITGFVRSENGRDGKRYFCDVFGPFHWDLATVQKRADYTFAYFTNEHSACYALTRKQLQRAIASGGFVVPPHAEKYDLLVTAATDPYTQCGFKKLLCISHLDDFTVPHLPDKYVGIYGVEVDEFLWQAKTLLSLNGHSNVWPLFAPVTKLRAIGYSKDLYAPARKELEELIPADVKSVLTLGCGQGRTEAWLASLGLRVTAVPLDPVISAGLASAGVEVIPGNFAAARLAINGRKFDCLLCDYLLHLLPEPGPVLAKFSEVLSPGGVAITMVPNVSRIAITRRKYRGSIPFRDLGDYSKTGVQLTSPRVLRSWYRQSGLKLERMVEKLPKRRQKAGRLTLGVANSLLAKEFVALGRKV
jgi:2-polyprenyl-3-methyl-5-hydroxy-6-metoxy-1,4-benzoquinol methylase